MTAKRLPSTGSKPWHGPRGVWPRTEDGKLVVTQSMVSGFVECPRETYYGIILGLRPRLESKPLTRGTWVHSLLEERANGGDWKAKHLEILEEHRFDQFEEEVDDLAQEVYNIMLSYDWVYKEDNLTPVAAELTVERPMFGGRALYRGRIDLIVVDENGDVWFVDHKTHRDFPDWRYRELAFQHYSYLWAARKSESYLELDLPQPRGFIYDYCKTSAIKTPSLTQSGRQSRALKPGGTTYPVYREWLKENKMLRTVRGQDLLAIEDQEERIYVEEFLVELRNRAYDDMFCRDYLTFTPDQARRQLKSFLTSAKRMLSYKWDDPDCVERNLHACSGFMCNYKDLTVADLIHGTSEIEQKTRYVTTRDPLDYYPNQKKGKRK